MKEFSLNKSWKLELLDKFRSWGSSGPFPSLSDGRPSFIISATQSDLVAKPINMQFKSEACINYLGVFYNNWDLKKL